MGTPNLHQRKSGRKSAPRESCSQFAMNRQLKDWLNSHGEPDKPTTFRQRISSEFVAAEKKRKP